MLLGSATKTYTAAAVMRLVEQGKVALDDPASKHIDPVLTAMNHTTLVGLFGPKHEAGTRTFPSLFLSERADENAPVRRQCVQADARGPLSAASRVAAVTSIGPPLLIQPLSLTISVALYCSP